MKKIITILCLTYLVSLMNVAHAEYVLPYPSYMPGNTLYRLSRIIDKVKSYWYWGNIASIKYHLGLSDKYLVEAKTLFEYKQYLLASDALTRSDNQLTDIPVLLQKGTKNGEDMSQLRQTIHDAMDVHTSVITSFKGELPPEFTWQPEKVSETQIHIYELLTASEGIRKQISDKISR